jgi:hypothetical protein
MLQRPRSNTPIPLRRLLPDAAGGACVLLVFAIAGAAMVPAGAQVQALGATPATSVTTAKPAAVSKPLWRDLSARQQRALEPLALQWDSLTEPHKRKWLALSRNYAKLSPAEQEILHSRMTEWATLSNQQRTQARLNFAERGRKARAGRPRQASPRRRCIDPAGAGPETGPAALRDAGRTPHTSDPVGAARVDAAATAAVSRPPAGPSSLGGPCRRPARHRRSASAAPSRRDCSARHLGLRHASDTHQRSALRRAVIQAADGFQSPRQRRCPRHVTS